MSGVGNSSVTAITSSEDDEYYQEAAHWNDELHHSNLKWVKMWRFIAMVFGAIAIASVVGLVSLMPLKTAVPYVIKVDQSTGIVETIEPITASDVPQDEVITKYFIVKYLNAREQFDYQRAEADYVSVTKLSSPKVANQYANWFAPGNAESPLNQYSDQHQVKIHVRDITFLDRDTAVIHIRRTTTKPDEPGSTYYVITLTFRYTQEPLTESDRFINPLGFQVLSYRKDPEIVEG